ncbi:MULTISPECIES: glycosyltransferase family 4 protein [unclassified Arsukibacterium]|uniref:glycosyltransferase family 4 protein n=1 Tax=unclassified Arsukibacterium TaxID=2635278 RepID=UPI000C94D009|nr:MULTISPECIES: glycosyltransferase family 4 protein [unclassified Arsukibacterium]MAA96131.1 glycosyltransferase WbuB [Rheinheimera sp.]HAW94452.1 glycosyltransferase WbuB [Candidatus Azambacteria bacterium]|tara:strand:+ start:3563 stop:4771 length:1209 start_codon:yes stop_codon:yes gene_type:complete
MRILFISQLFDPEYSIKGLALMKHWVAQGHEVEVLTTFPNYPTGKVFDGYKVKLRSTEMIDGVKVTRLWSHISHSKSKLSRAASYLSYTFMALAAVLFQKKPDLVYTYHPQSTTGVIGILMRALRGVPFVTDVQDLWPDALAATGMNQDGLLLRLVDRWCRLVYRKASQIVVLSEGFRQALVARGVAAEKLNLVYNWCPEELRISEVLAEPGNVIPDVYGPANFLYAGNMGAAQSLKSVIDAVANFDKRHVVLTLIGGGVEKEELQQYIARRAIDNVIIGDYVPAAKIIGVLKQADILVVHLREDPLFRITIPSKTQSSLAMGKPLLMAVGGEANQLISEAKAGEIAEPQNVASITDAIETLLAQRARWPEMGANARRFYLKQLSASTNYAKLDDVINKAVN